jgi:phosphoserine phosphatase RsbU/P
VLLHHDTDRFCTLTVLRLHHEARGWTVTVSCGGHPLPFLIRQQTLPVTFGRPGSLVGVLDEPRFSDVTVKLGAGDVIVLHTDGVTEARNQKGEFYGDARLTAFLASGRLSAPALVDGLLDEVMQFQSQQPRDDIALVCIVVPENGEMGALGKDRH